MYIPARVDMLGGTGDEGHGTVVVRPSRRSHRGLAGSGSGSDGVSCSDESHLRVGATVVSSLPASSGGLGKGGRLGLELEVFDRKQCSDAWSRCTGFWVRSKLWSRRDC